jgi:benzoyl-CoA reductase subunit C
MFHDFEKILEDRHKYARELKSSKKKNMIGYMCSYTPEEIIYAAGFIPVRFLSSEDNPTLAETYMQTYYCTFSRSLLHQALSGNMDYIDGFVTAYSCATMRLAFENLQVFGKSPYARLLYLPGIIDTPEAKEFYYKELVRFKKDMEDLSGRIITDDDLREAIKIYDENRALTMEIFDGRKGDPPNITGKEAFTITISGMLTDKRDHNEMLRILKERLSSRETLLQDRNRLMIVGSPLDNLKMFDIIEGDGRAYVVTDDNCMCTRYSFGTTPVDYIHGDPLKALVERYLISRPPCPTKHSPSRYVECVSCPFREVSCMEMVPDPRQKLRDGYPFKKPERMCRFRHSVKLAINHKVEGAIIIQQKFCDPHGFDYHHMVQAFTSAGIPTLFLEIDNVITTGPLKTRVQAFIEMLEPVEYVIEPEIRDAIQ